jgi:hypothetical protein
MHASNKREDGRFSLCVKKFCHLPAGGANKISANELAIVESTLAYIFCGAYIFFYGAQFFEYVISLAV